MELGIDKIEVITWWYKHPKAGWVYINPTTNEEFIKRKISIEGHLSADLFPFWVSVNIKYPPPPPNYPECRKVYHTAVLTAPFSANFRVLINAFDDRAYSYGQIGKEYLLVSMEGLYNIDMQASWLPFGIRVAASNAIILDVNTTHREDKVEKFTVIPHDLIYTEEEGESKYATRI